MAVTFYCSLTGRLSFQPLVLVLWNSLLYSHQQPCLCDAVCPKHKSIQLIIKCDKGSCQIFSVKRQELPRTWNWNIKKLPTDCLSVHFTMSHSLSWPWGKPCSLPVSYACDNHAEVHGSETSQRGCFLYRRKKKLFGTVCGFRVPNGASRRRASQPAEFPFISGAATWANTYRSSLALFTHRNTPQDPVTWLQHLSRPFREGFLSSVM